MSLPLAQKLNKIAYLGVDKNELTVKAWKKVLGKELQPSHCPYVVFLAQSFEQYN